MSQRTRRPVAGIVALLAVALVALPACGSRLSDDDLQAGQRAGAGASSGTTGGASGAEAVAPMFGSLEVPCGPRAEDDPGTYGDSDQGVTADSIAIGTIADPGGAKPGLNQGAFDAMEAFVDWCNDLGGINGRQLELTLRDAKLFEYKQRVLEACAEDFALVGSIAVFDNQGTVEQDGCGLPNVAASVVSQEQSLSELTWQPLPNEPGYYVVGPARWIAAEYPDVITRAASVYANVPSVQTQNERLRDAYTQVGFDFVNVQGANNNETNWAPIVVAMKDAGVEFVTGTGAFEDFATMQKEMAVQGFDPVMEFETNFYNDGYPAQAGDAAEGVYVRVYTWPFEEADQSEALTRYLEIIEEYNPDAVEDFMAVQAFSAGLLWATAVDSLGADVTREALAGALDGIKEWNGGGLQVPTNPGDTDRGTCFALMQVRDGGFVRAYPLPDDPDYEGGFACPEDGQVPVDLGS
ncbi:MAG: ABC transporter substrate-binding protein [Acidimicrobiales bacterium]|nr:ABC transporter substrate-binding protein [Acidimicrobiales bacterium]